MSAIMHPLDLDKDILGKRMQISQPLDLLRQHFAVAAFAPNFLHSTQLALSSLLWCKYSPTVWAHRMLMIWTDTTHILGDTTHILEGVKYVRSEIVGVRGPRDEISPWGGLSPRDSACDISREMS